MTEPAQLQDWLSTLPFTRLTDCGRQLVEALSQLNRVPLDCTVRYRLLLQYLATIDHYYPALEGEMQQGDPTTSMRARQATRLGLQLFVALHTGFKRALSDRLAKRGFLERDQPKIDLAAYTLLTARQIIYIAAGHYASVGEGFWHDCHTIYCTVREAGWADRPSIVEDTLEVLYLQILLMGITPSKGLTEAEFYPAQQIILQYASSACLIPVEELAGPMAGFYVHCNHDTPPRWLGGEGSQQADWLLDVSRLAEHLHERQMQLEQIKGSSPASGPVETELALVRRLTHEWRHPPRRRHTRLPLGERVAAISQLIPIWQYLQAQAGRPLPGVPFVKPAQMEVVNQSPLGFLLRGHSQGYSLRVGELLLLHPPAKPTACTLCVIRWVALPADSDLLECGVEVLGRLPVPVLAMPTITHQADTLQPALKLPAITKLGRPPLLLLPGRLFSRLREFRLQEDGDERLVRSTRLDRQTPHYQLMEFQDSAHF